MFRAPAFQDIQRFLYTSVNPVSVQTILGQKKFCVPVGNDTIGNTHADYADLVLQPVLFQQLQHGAAEPAASKLPPLSVVSCGARPSYSAVEAFAIGLSPWLRFLLGSVIGLQRRMNLDP